MTHAEPSPTAAVDPAAAVVAGWAACGIVGVGLTALGAAAVGHPAPACLLRTATGMPCPACGLTRLAQALVDGRIGAALAYDPAGVALLVVVAAMAVRHLVGVARRRPGSVGLGHRGVVVAALLLAAAHWGTVLTRGLPGSI